MNIAKSPKHSDTSTKTDESQEEEIKSPEEYKRSQYEEAVHQKKRRNAAYLFKRDLLKGKHLQEAMKNGILTPQILRELQKDRGRRQTTTAAININMDKELQQVRIKKET